MPEQRSAPAPVSPLRSLAAAIGNRAFAAHVARQPMTASEEDEEIPASITRVAEDVVAKPLDAVAEQLDTGTPRGKWPALRARIRLRDSRRVAVSASGTPWG